MNIINSVNLINLFFLGKRLLLEILQESALGRSVVAVILKLAAQYSPKNW